MLVKKDPSITYWRDNKGLTPPLIAATLNPCYIQALKVMLKHCPGCIEETDNFGNTILHLMNKLSIITDNFIYLIDPTISLIRFPPLSSLINEQNNDGDTPTHIAIRNHNIELTAILIKCSASLTIKNKNGSSAADMFQQSSDKFRTLVKDKAKEIGMQMLTNAYSNYVSTKSVMEIGLSIEKLTEAKMMDKITEHGNILHTLLHNCPTNMEDDEVKELVRQALDMAPSLICELNSKGQTPLHRIAQHRPSLIDQLLRQVIQDCYEQVTVYDDAIEGLLYDPPWKVKDEDGNTILHLALSDIWPDNSIHEILQFDLDLVNEVNKKGELPLHVVVRTVCNPDLKRKYAQMVHSGLVYDIQSDMDIIGRDFNNISDKEGLTPLLIAAQAKDLECFNLLLGWHAYDGDKLEHIRNCDLKTKYEGDPDGNTFWHHIATIQVTDDSYDATNTEYIWTHSCFNACNALTQTNKSGRTPFHIAIENGNFKLATMFSKAIQGDEWREWKFSHLVYNDMGDKEGNVPLHLVVGRCDLPNARQFIECVTSSTELIGVHNNNEMTPLHLAVHKNDIEFLNIIFDVKRDDKVITRQILQIADTDDNTSLHYSISQGALEFVDVFFDGGVRAESIDEILDMINKDGNAPLHLAVLEGHSSLASKFIDIANEKNFLPQLLYKPDKEGNTALHLMVLKNNRDMAEILMETAKENKYIQEILIKCNNEGNTPLHLAIQNRDFNLVKCFIEYAIQGSCIDKILDIPNNENETPGSLLGSAEHLPKKFEKFFWNEPKVVQAMLGVRSLSGVPTNTIKEYTNTIGVIAALLATITFTAGFTVPGGLDSSSGAPLLMQKLAFQVFMVSDIIAMCLSMMVLFFLMWIMTINDEKHQVILLDLTVLSLQGSFYATILTFMTGLYASVFPTSHWIAIFSCVLCSLLILLMHKRLIILFIPGFVHIYVWYHRVYSLIKKCCCNDNQNNGEPSEISRHANKWPTGDSQTVVNIEPNN